MITLHGLFHLREQVQDTDFRAAYEAFGEHLSSRGYVVSWRFMRRSPHEGYDARPPGQPFYVSMTFLDIEAAHACYSYVEADEEPLKTLHRAVNRKVHTTQFFLCEDI